MLSTKKFRTTIHRILAGLMLLAFQPAHATASGTDKSKVTLAWEKSPRTIDPRYAVDADSQYLADLIHCSLINFAKNGTTVGDLGTSWKWTNNKTLEVKLNPNAKFSDGSKVTGSDVKATYDYFLKKDLKKPTPLAGAYRKLSSVTTKDNTVSFNLTEPDSTFVTNLIVGILPAKLAAGGHLDVNSAVPSCGPFVLRKIDVSQILLEKNPKYSLGKPAKASKIVIKIVKDETTRFAKLRKGEVDLVQNIINRDKIHTIAKKYPFLKVQRQAGLKTTYLGFNMTDKTLSHVNVRKAISKAINREVIIKYLLNGLAVPAVSMLTPNDPFLNKQLSGAVYDRAAAEKLLDDAGFKRSPKSKMRFSLTYKTTQNATRIGIAKAIAADLKKIGIQVKVQPLEWGRFKADVEAGHVQLWSLAWVGFKDPDIFRYAFATESFAPNGGNRGKYSNVELDKLVMAGKIATDFKTRQKAYDRVQEILADELPYVFLWHEENFAIMNKSIQGFEIYADGRFSSLKNVVKQ